MQRKKVVLCVDPRLGHADVSRADDELYAIAGMDGPLDDADLKAISRRIGACDGGGGTTAVACGRIGGVDGRGIHRIAPTPAATTVWVADEHKVGATGVFFRHEEPKSHLGEEEERRLRAWRASHDAIHGVKLARTRGRTARAQSDIMSSCPVLPQHGDALHDDRAVQVPPLPRTTCGRRDRAF